MLWAIGAHEEDRGKYAYDLPKNVTEVHECFLDTPLRDKESFGGGQRHLGLSDDQLEALGQLVACDDPDWGALINVFQGGFDARDVLMSEDYLRMVVEVCRERYPHAPFAQVFHTSRSMLLPVLYLLGRPIPQADVYHTVCTGYGGALASMGHIVTGKPLILSEHGIYSREREEELIRTDWVQATFKRRWIRFFYMLSNLSSPIPPPSPAISTAPAAPRWNWVPILRAATWCATASITSASRRSRPSPPRITWSSAPSSALRPSRMSRP